MTARFAVALTLIAILFASCDRGPNRDDHFFDGASLTGWSASNPVYWSVQDSAIVGQVSDDLKKNQFIWSDVKVNNFYLAVDVKLDSADRNAGIQFRSVKVDSSGQAKGYQADIGMNLGHNIWGTLYHEYGRDLLNGSDSAASAVRDGEWNHYEILATGDRIWTAVNGVIGSATRDSFGESSGFVAFQIHAGPPQTVRYRIRSLIHDPAVTLAGLNESQLNRLLKAPFNPAEGHSLIEFHDRDTIVFAGGTNISAMQEDGRLEALISSWFPERRFYFRNMGWDGDTVFEQYRDDGFGSWARNIDSIRANIALLQFGQMESLDTTHSLPEFIAAYRKLIREIHHDGRKIVILSPTPFEPSFLPAQRNPLLNTPLEEYIYQIQKLSQDEDCAYVDLYYALKLDTLHAVTYDGIHLNENGQQKVTEFIMRRFGSGLKYAAALDPLKSAILEKNKIWFDYWRPGNWAFYKGNRMDPAFSRDWRDYNKRIFPEEITRFGPLLDSAEQHIANILTHKIDKETPIIRSMPPPADTVRHDDYSPEAELAAFKLDKRFSIELFASEKLGIAEPCTMRWDEQGRLWVLCIPAYPQPKPGQSANDRLVVLEDSNKDGRADRSTIFADRLDIPLGFELGDGGVWLGEQTRMLFLKDTNNDLKADAKQVMLSGFGTHDSHQTINSFIWSPGGELFFSQGLSIHSRVETAYGVKKADRGAIWRYRPLTRQLDNIVDESTASDNPWGMNFGDWGELFSKSNDTGLYFMNPAFVTGGRKTLVPEIGATVIKSGTIEMPRSAHLPDEMRKQILVAGYYNNRIERLDYTDDGAGFKAKLIEPLLISTSKNFRPVDIKVGPDGAIYILDWFNPVIGHYQASLRDPLRDKTHGRIWRITYKKKPLSTPPLMVGQSASSLVKQLGSSEYWVRYQARRLLKTLSWQDVKTAADQWKTSNERNLMEVLALYESRDLINPTLVSRLLKAQTAGARGYAAQVAGRWLDREPDLISRIEPLLHDPVPRVRLQALVAVGLFNHPSAVTKAAAVLSHPMDKFLNHAWEKMVVALQSRWEPALRSGTIVFKRPAHRDAVLNIISDKRGGLDNAIKESKKIQELLIPDKTVRSNVPGNVSNEFITTLTNAAINANSINGKNIYFTKLSCSACHSLNGKGGNIGPNLSAVGSGLSPSDLITEVLWPNKNIKEGYFSIRLHMKDGRTVQGIRVMQSSSAIAIKINASAKPVTIERKDIISVTEIGSAMPSGLTNSLSSRERADLIRFLMDQTNGIN